jgi:hypothetical protein
MKLFFFNQINSSELGWGIMLTPGQTRWIGESESKGKGDEECGSNLMR